MSSESEEDTEELGKIRAKLKQLEKKKRKLNLQVVIFCVCLHFFSTVSAKGKEKGGKLLLQKVPRQKKVRPRAMQNLF